MLYVGDVALNQSLRKSKRQHSQYFFTESGILVTVYTYDSDPISDVVAYGKSRYPCRLYESCHAVGNHSHIIITCSRLATN